jgi:hypothetical protein
MTAFITRCLARSLNSRWATDGVHSSCPKPKAARGPAGQGLYQRVVRRLCTAIALALLVAVAAPARADTIEVVSASLEGVDDNYALNAQFEFEFNARLEEAVNKGLPLYFLVEFELTRGRWYWFDEKAATQTQTIRISYHALTRQYRISTGSLHLGFGTLGEAVRVLKNVRNWVVLEKAQVQRGQRYTASVRMRLDLTQLPKPFQVTALTNREWTLASDWYRFPFSFVEPEHEGKSEVKVERRLEPAPEPKPGGEGK